MIPMLVAHRARPTNAAVSISAPIASPSPIPAAIGRIMAMTAVRTAGRPTASRSSRRTSSPTLNNRMITPSSEKTAAVSPGTDEPEGIGSDDEATEQLADNGGLTQAARDLLAELRADEQDEQAEQDVGWRFGGSRGRGDGRPDLTEGERVTSSPTGSG